jgi:hypothetical protein
MHYRVSRRAVVASGAGVAYAIPVIAATMRLTTRDTTAAGYCGSCFDDALSTKRLDGECYSCKVPESGCVATRSGVQADDLSPDVAGGLYCRCQGNTCVINGITFSKNADVTAGTNGACRPYLITNTRYDLCTVSDQISLA